MFSIVHINFDDKVNGVFGGLASSTLHFCGEIVQLQLGVWGLVAIIIHNGELHNGVHIAGT